MVDISDTLAPKSDQLDAVDLEVSGPMTFTIKEVTRNNGDQPVNIKLAEFPRVWRPGKSMRRVLAKVWGVEAARWVDHRLTLWCDPAVKFGGVNVGGVRILAMSHIDKPTSVVLLESKGKSITYTVKPLAEDPAAALTAARERVKAAAPKDKDLRTWVPAALDARGLDGTKPADLVKLAEELEGQS